jgi:4-hydroxy-tetrahydrodipicolinate synthase
MDKTKLWTALVTPFEEHGIIDFDSLDNLLRRQESAGNGILLLGSTGEGLALDTEEKKQVVVYATGMDLKVPVMAGIGGYKLHKQVNFIKRCDQSKVDAFLLVTPLYAKPGKNGQIEWFSKLMEATDKPCMLYNVPSRAGTKLHPEVPKVLSERFDNLMGVKEASGSVAEFKLFRETAPNVDFYSGDDGLTPDFAKEGAVGLVSVASNIWPEATSKYLDLCLAGKHDGLKEAWLPAIEQLFNGPNPVPTKALLHHKKLIGTDTVRPPLSQADLGSLQMLIEMDVAIKAWFSKQ